MEDAPAENALCPDCGTELRPRGAAEGLCPHCLLSLALHDLELPLEVDDAAETLDRPSAGRVLGGRYQMRELLGRGGMGEVWRAFDLKLRVDVALKAIRPERAQQERAQELLRQEVRSAREVVSPNVCRIFDLVVEDGQELVSMELVDGSTLTDTLRVRGPLLLPAAREIASQFLSGLEAIHQAGLVHRDFKPENVMITRSGRVVVMDFGLAKGLGETKTGTISGTPAYMAPEQARGESVDARADVFSAGLVLAEMLVVGGEGAIKARQALWKGVREVPPQVPEGPWATVLKQALAYSPDARQPSARTLARALEEVTIRLPGFEDKRPYPGLSFFTEEDAEHFFGREVEVEAVLQKLKRPRLVALIGPSGAGKSSFLRAGLLPALPRSWKVALSTPGRRPFQALAQALAPAFSGDTEAVQALLRFEEPDTAVALLSKWRQRNDHAVIVVDQFEELFTLNPPEVQAAFAALLGRLVLEADLRVLLSLRDDFLFHCHAHEALVPAFSDLTPLAPLSDSSLRRALVQPALTCGYRFEDDALVDEMVAAVSRERGALPLLAFAASRLWEKRDRERGLLTRQAYQEIGGVAGALAQHAEATLETIGAARAPVVRELFRNLITSQGTRASREGTELLSVFGRGEGSPERIEAAGVLDALVAARLLTAYERPGEEGKESRQEVEVIHESLLANWPRLVRWQTQDADGAQLRDQLRQAAQVWASRGRPEDLLWSGTAYRDFALWKERYPGGLSATEEAFAEAATRRAGRRRRQRRLAVSIVVGVALAVAGVMSSMWQHSEESRRKAEAEALRAESSKLLALGQLELERFPTAAVAYSLKSLELTDTIEARLFAWRALQRGPTAVVVPAMQEPGLEAFSTDFSPNGEWLAVVSRKVQLRHQDGRSPVLFTERNGFDTSREAMVGFGPDGGSFVTNQGGEVRGWDPASGAHRWRAQPESGPSGLFVIGDHFFTSTTVGDREVIRRWSFSGESRIVGTMEALLNLNVPVALTDEWFAYARGRKVYLRSLADWSSPPRLLAEHAADVVAVAFHPNAEQLAVNDKQGEIRIWPTSSSAGRPSRVFRSEGTNGIAYDPSGRWLAAFGFPELRPILRLWDLAAAPDAEPLVLRRFDADAVPDLAFGPAGAFVATAHIKDAALWSLGGRHVQVLASRDPLWGLAFTPDGGAIVSLGGPVSYKGEGEVRFWPLSAGGDQHSHSLLRTRGAADSTLTIDPGGKLVAARDGDTVLLAPLAGGPARRLTGVSETPYFSSFAFSRDGRRLAAATHVGAPSAKAIRVWDLETGQVQVVGPVRGVGEAFEGGIQGLALLGGDRLLAGTLGVGLVLFDLRDGRAQVLTQMVNTVGALCRDGETLFGVYFKSWDPRRSELVRFRLGDSQPKVLASHGDLVCSRAVALDPSETLVATGSEDGIVRLGPVDGGEPHYFFGHEGGVTGVAFSPDGHWLASAGADKTIRLWPVPDASEQPFHTLPRAELLRRLRALTNLRALPDSASATGYKLEYGPFPGWRKISPQ